MAVSKRTRWYRQYRAYLKSEDWKVFREFWFKRHPGVRCFICNARPAYLHLHHLTYENLGDEFDDDLRAVCEPCHRALHAYAKKYKLSVYDGTFAYKDSVARKKKARKVLWS